MNRNERQAIFATRRMEAEREVVRLREVNAELLEALRLSEEVSNSQCFRSDVSKVQIDLIARWRDAFTAAIKKAEGR